MVFNGSVKYRLVAETAGDGLILRAGPRIDFLGKYALAPNAEELAFERNSGFLIGGNELRIDFFRMDVRPDRTSAQP